MTEIILSFPVRNRASLSCMWIETGNPAQPLVCQWIARHQTESVHKFDSTFEPPHRRLCA
jgi:hypothetical protein